MSVEKKVMLEVDHIAKTFFSDKGDTVMFKVADENTVLKNYEAAKSAYRALGVNTDAVIARYKTIPISLQNWQGDDVGGFEKTSAASEETVISPLKRSLFAASGSVLPVFFKISLASDPVNTPSKPMTKQ